MGVKCLSSREGAVVPFLEGATSQSLDCSGSGRGKREPSSNVLTLIIILKCIEIPMS